jgi:CBS-domain-containing membrane protein
MLMQIDSPDRILETGVKNMNKQYDQKLQPNDFVMALQEMGTYVDVSINDLLHIQKLAEKYSRLRNTEGVLVAKLMSQPVVTVRPDSSLSDAAHLLVKHKISGLPIVSDQDKLIGIITEADFLRALGVPSRHPGHSVWQTLENIFNQPVQVSDTEGLVSDLMMKNVITISPHRSLNNALEKMKQHQIKRLVVCDDAQRVIGMITRSDLISLFFDHFKTNKTVI